MKNKMMILMALSLSFLQPAPAYAADNKLGVIVSSGASTTNLTTAAPFTIPNGIRIAVQCRQQATVKVGTSAVSVADANDGTFVDVGPLYDVMLEAGANVVAILPVSGSATCVIFDATVR